MFFADSDHHLLQCKCTHLIQVNLKIFGTSLDDTLTKMQYRFTVAFEYTKIIPKTIPAYEIPLTTVYRFILHDQILLITFVVR